MVVIPSTAKSGGGANGPLDFIRWPARSGWLKEAERADGTDCEPLCARRAGEETPGR